MTSNVGEGGIKNFHILSIIFVLQLICYSGRCIPKRGNEPWSIILCKFADINYEPKPRQWFQQWINGINQSDSIERYFDEISNKVYSIKGSQVHGWHSLNYTFHQVLKLIDDEARHLPSDKERYFAKYDKIKQMCIGAAEDAGEYLHEQKITVINAEHAAVYGKKYGILVTPKLIYSSVITHEMVHSFFIGHSYSDRNIQVFPHASTGEYDDVYDLMSTANALMHPSPFGFSGPGLNGPHLDYLGWLPMHRIAFFGRDGRNNYTLRISSSSVPHNNTKGWLLVLVPYDRDDPGNVFTVEFRTKSNQDSGIQESAVIVHKVKRVGPNYYSAVITHASNHYELLDGHEWINFLGVDSSSRPRYIKIRVIKISSSQQYADVKIISNFNPDACDTDELDVKLGIDDPSHVVNHICVPKTAAYNKNDLLELQETRHRFFKDRLTFGMNECVAGKVWRAIDPYDYVCVNPLRISDIINDAKLNSSRQTKNGCIKPYVPRNAFYGDAVCVTNEERIKIREDNFAGYKYLKYYAFFNGEDSVEETSS